MTYAVGKSRWATDWNYVLPSAPDAAGVYQPCAGVLTFELAQAPREGATASLYLGCAGDDGGHVTVGVNDVNLGSAAGVTAAPDPVSADGFAPPYSDDSSIHFAAHGPFSDERINFPGRMLHAGRNTITIRMDARSLTAYLMVDFLRLELTGYVPPAPASVAAYPGSSRVLVCWPLVPGAASYTVLRAAGGTYSPISTGNSYPVSGSGPGQATYTDTTAINGTAYTYAVQSVNPAGHSVSSPPSPRAMPLAKLPSHPPAAPVKLAVTSSGHHHVTLAWTASAGADFYRVWRTTLHSDGVGGVYPLRTILLEDATAGTGYTDNSPSDGRAYRYGVEAVGAAGTSGPSPTVTACPLPAAPASAPEALTAHWTKTRNGSAVALAWSPAPGATGYVIYRTTGAVGAFRWPANFLTALAETTYVDKGATEKNATLKGLDDSTDYTYQVTAVNPAGISPPATVHVPAH